ncbi:hypothetical protein SK128_012821, partial [Halocaridina rubra]
ELRAMANVGSGPLSVVVDRTRALMSEFVERQVIAAAGGAAQGGAMLLACRGDEIGGCGQSGYLQWKVNTDCDSAENNQLSGRCCYRCGGPLLIRFCRSTAKSSC